MSFPREHRFLHSRAYRATFKQYSFTASSMLAYFSLLGSSQDQSKRARVKEHRLANGPSKLARSIFVAGLIGLLLRAWTSTDFLQYD